MNTSGAWRPVTIASPCPACQGTDWCAFTPDGAMLKCERTSEAPPGWVRVKPIDAGALFRPAGPEGNFGHNRRPAHGRADGPVPPESAQPSKGLDWKAEAARLGEALGAEQHAGLAATLGVSVAALAALGCGWATRVDLGRFRASGADWSDNYPEGAFAFPERDGSGRIIGLSLRASDGRKGSPSRAVGARRGLIVPRTLRDLVGPALLVEGASDVAACVALGLAAVGRPSNAAGADAAAILLEGREVLVVGERDQKESGEWPGRKGAKAVAARIAGVWAKGVPWTLPPEGAKDVRAWLQHRIAGGLDLADPEACRAAGAELLAALRAAAVVAEAEAPPKMAEALVQLAQARYRFGVAEGDEPFAVPLEGPNVAIMFRGSRDALRATLAREYRQQHGRTPSAAALADALVVLQGDAQQSAPEPVYLRVAAHEGSLILDLGGKDGRAVVIRPEGWEVGECSPVLFKRTALTSALPEPERGGDVDLLREVLNVAEDSWPLAVGWIVGALFAGISHPILMFGGLHGSGKTTSARFLVWLVDPVTVENHPVPRDPEGWAMAASGSWCVLVDNVSNIPEGWSDALCKAATGAGWIRRRLYTEGELSVLSFRRVVAITSIDAGSLRGDLGDRMLIVDLEAIPSGRRRDETTLNRLYSERRPAILGAILDLASCVLRELPTVELPGLPRMADYARILAALDRVRGTDGLGLYLAQHSRIAADEIDTDPIGAALMVFAASVGEWTGTAGDLWKRITPEPRPDDWPRSSRGFSGKLRRLIPSLAIVGVQVIPPAKTDKTRRYKVRATAPTARKPGDGPDDDGEAGAARADGDSPPPDRPGNRPDTKHSGTTRAADPGRSGDPGGPPRPPSESCRACGHAKWWRFVGQEMWTCGACHTPTGAGAVEWMNSAKSAA